MLTLPQQDQGNTGQDQTNQVGSIPQPQSFTPPGGGRVLGTTNQPQQVDNPVIKHLQDPNVSPEKKYATVKMLKQHLEDQKSTLEKSGDAVDKVMGPLSNFFFGTTAKVAGSMVGDTYENVASLVGRKKTGVFEKQLDELTKTPGQAAKNAVGLALESYPIGGEMKYLKKIPGVAKVAEVAGDMGEKIGNKASSFLNKSAVKSYAKALNPTTKEAKVLAKKEIPELLKRNITFTSPEKLATKAEGFADKAGENVEKYWNDLPEGKKISARPVLDTLNTLKNKYIVEGKVVNQPAVNAIDQTAKTIAQFGDNISQKSMRSIRQIFDEHFDVTKGIDDIGAYTKKAQQSAANAIRSELSKNSPKLEKLNSEYTFWNNVKDIAEKTAQREFGKPGKYFSHALGGVIGYEGGKREGSGGASIGAILGTVAGPKIFEFLKGPGWKSVSAVTKNKVADYIAAGKIYEAASLLGKLVEGVRNVENNPKHEPRKLILKNEN